MLVEVCANSLESARVAEAAGADRIELCCELAVGGVTPSFGMLGVVRDAISIPIHVLIRPRSGNFSYTDGEFDAMQRDIAHCRKLGMNGIVSGCLRPDGTVDTTRTGYLMREAAWGRFTFHRAFDRCPDAEKALQELDSLGVSTILSSGQHTTAEAGLPLLERLQARARHCSFMPGGGIGPDNVLLFEGKGFEAVHLSGISKSDAGETYFGPPMNSAQLLREEKPLTSDQERIAEVLRKLRTQKP
jgi:copper homeostasis protein